MIIGPSEHGTHVLNNIVQNNVNGLYLSNDSGTDPAVIQYNVFRNNNNPGNNGGHAIYTDGGISGGNLTNVLIDSNVFYNNRGGPGCPTSYEAAINFCSRTANSQSNFTITNNTFDTNGKGVLGWNLSGITIKYNVITNTLDHWSGTWRFEGCRKERDDPVQQLVRQHRHGDSRRQQGLQRRNQQQQICRHQQQLLRQQQFLLEQGINRRRPGPVRRNLQCAKQLVGQCDRPQWCDQRHGGPDHHQRRERAVFAVGDQPSGER